ncbi:MAG: DUF4838 domain-containing protein, partial [Candidatus Hydrogenedentes bacterium]|nr:DUF4838 domain-containing protein [Candidatus Hydrogenedentota bacterium]
MMATVVTVLIISSAAHSSAGVWTTQDHYGDFQIVLSEHANDSEKLAANELQRYWKGVLGHSPDILTATSGKPTIWLGFDPVPPALLNGVEPASFSDQELWIKTLTHDGQPNLIIAGGKELGTLYGAYQFIEDYLGVRWLAPGETYVPKTPKSLPNIDVRYKPSFEFRYSTYFNNISDREGLQYYRQVHRWLPGPNFGCHSFYRMVPPEKYGKEHPEYFSMVNGKRTFPTTTGYYNAHPPADQAGKLAQLCMSNPEVAEVIMQRLREDIKANPNEKTHHISQMDWGGNCECEQCKAVDDREGTPMGSVLTGLNRVADMLAKEYPGHMIETLAYTYTRKPPAHLAPRPNVAIKLCSIECDFFRRFDDKRSKLNRTFAEDIDAWSKIAPRLHVWDYTTNYYNFQMPMVNFHVLQPNMQFLAAHNVKGMFPQGSYDTVAEFAPLRAYMLSKLMWNLNIDFDAVMKEFIDLYYQEAAPYVRDYIALLTKRVDDAKAVLNFNDKGAWYDVKTVEKAQALFKEAYANVSSDVTRRRLDIVHATVQYAALTCPPQMTITKDKIVLTRPPSQTLEEYFAMLKSYDVKNIVDYFPLEDFLTQLHGVTPPRHSESALLKLENERNLLWVAPQLEGSILRWRDKALRAELLTGYKTYSHGVGTWQDWTITPGVAEKRVALTYETVASDKTGVTLKARLDSGLLLEKRIELNAGTVNVALTLVNDTDAPIAPAIKVHPEFYTQGPYRPEIWGLGNQGWRMLNKDIRETIAAYGERLPVNDLTRLAAHVPEKRLTIFTDFSGQSSVAALLYFYNAAKSACQVNLELIPV